VLAVGLLAMSLAVTGCTNTSQYGFDVWNYSANRYVVRLTFQDGTAEVVAMPPRAIVRNHGLSDPQQAVVYDQTCSRKLATLPLSGHWAYILVDTTGAISVASSVGLHTDADPTYADSEAIPSSCPSG
jgi:hypothetical protein